MIETQKRNHQGQHGAGAARDARDNWGAVQGVGYGRTGHSFAIPTERSPWRRLLVEGVTVHVNRFRKWLNNCVSPDVDVIISAVGCGLAGYTAAEIAPLFAPCNPLAYCPYEWMSLMDKQQKVHKFYDSLAVGGEGEQIVAAILSSRGVAFSNVTDLPNYQVIDIDFLVTSKWRWKTIEVKADQYQDNFFIETVSNLRTDRPGWLWGSKADVIAYCFTRKGITYWLPLKALQEVMMENTPAWECYKKEVKNRDSFSSTTNDPQNEAYYRTTIGYAVPIDVLLRGMTSVAGQVFASPNPAKVEAFELRDYSRGSVMSVSRKVA